MSALPAGPDPRDDGHPGDRLSALLDGELDPVGETVVQEHLASCPSCREELDRLAQARRLLRGMAPVEPPTGLAERFGARVRRLLRLVAGGVTVAGAGLAAILYATPPAREVRPPMEVAGNPLPVLPAGAPITVVPAGYYAPEALDGLPLVGLRQVGPMLGALYGSSARDVLVLEEPGRLEADTSYPAQQASLGGHQGLRFGTAGDEAFTWQDGPAVVTLVGAPEDLAAAAGSMTMRPRPQSLLDRARRLSRDLVDDLTG